MHDGEEDSGDEDIYCGTSEGATAAGHDKKRLDLAAAKSPDYATKKKRRESFKTWPKPKVDINEMINAGLFYTGDEDRTECFFCGIRLRQWEIHDDPSIEHARFSGSCEFIQAHKGVFFIIASLEFYDLPTTDVKLQLPSKSLPYGASESLSKVQSHVPVRRPQGPRRNKPVEPREIRSRLDVDGVKMLQRIGFPRELIGQIIGERLQTEGDDFERFGDLVRAVFSAADNLRINIPLTMLQTATASKTRPESSQTYPGASANRIQGSSPLTFTATSNNECQDPAKERAMDENRKLKEKVFCNTCWKTEANVVLLNCGHMVLCEDCAKLAHICPKCHRHIVQRVKVFVA